MKHPIHALDSFFYTSMGVYAFQPQCEMLAEIGYDGITVAGWGGTPYTDLSLLPGVKARHGLDVTSLYLVLHAGRNDAALRRIVEMVEGVELIELAIQTTVNGTDGILRSIESLLPIIERRGLRLLASARSKNSIGVQAITPETLITIDGVESTVKFFESIGMVHRGADGRYAEGPPQGDQLEVEQPEGTDDDAPMDDLSMPSEIAEAVDRSLDGVADQDLDTLVATGISVASGQLDRAALERRLVTASGCSPEEASVRVQTTINAFQGQVDAALTARCGLGESDLPTFYAWAEANHVGDLRDAVGQQINNSNLSGFRALADRFLADNPPSLAAVKAGGYQTRMQGNEPEALIEGRWMTLRTAARLGLL